MPRTSKELRSAFGATLDISQYLRRLGFLERQAQFFVEPETISTRVLGAQQSPLQRPTIVAFDIPGFSPIVRRD